MSNAVMGIGAIILVLGLIGLFGWIAAFNEISGTLETMKTGESAARAVSPLVGWIPFVGGAASGIADSTANALNALRTTITMYFYYNIMLNIAIMLCGFGLIFVGKEIGAKENKIEKIRSYLKKQKDEKEDDKKKT